MKTSVNSLRKKLETKSLRAVQGKGKGLVFCCIFVFLKGRNLRQRKLKPNCEKGGCPSEEN